MCDARQSEMKNKYRRVFINKQRNIETRFFFFCYFRSSQFEILEVDDELLTFFFLVTEFVSRSCLTSISVSTFSHRNGTDFQLLFFFSGRLRWKSFISDYINWSLADEWTMKRSKMSWISWWIYASLIRSFFFEKFHFTTLAKSRDFEFFFFAWRGWEEK